MAAGAALAGVVGASGEAFGLLANGAGKTMLVKILLGSLTPLQPRHRAGWACAGAGPAGSATARGHRFPATCRAQRCVCSTLAARRGDSHARELLALVGLSTEVAIAFPLLKGMTQRLGLACALLDEPGAVLDEPTDGVVPSAGATSATCCRCWSPATSSSFAPALEVERTRDCGDPPGRLRGRCRRPTHPSQRFHLTGGAAACSMSCRYRRRDARRTSRSRCRTSRP